MIRSWWVMTPVYETYRGSYDPPEPPESGRDVAVVHASTRREARMKGARALLASGSEYVRDSRGDGRPPWSDLELQLADCHHGTLCPETTGTDLYVDPPSPLGDDALTPCPFCEIEAWATMRAEEEVLFD